MGSQVCGTGSNNISGFSWYYGAVGGGNCAIGVGNKLCAGSSDDACEENQKFHVCS